MTQFLLNEKTPIIITIPFGARRKKFPHKKGTWSSESISKWVFKNDPFTLGKVLKEFVTFQKLTPSF